MANDLPDMVKAIGDRIHFAHLRNVKKDEDPIMATRCWMTLLKLPTRLRGH